MERHLAEGVPAPDFNLPTQEGKSIRLSDYKGKKNVILYFYPKDDTPGCTKEACNFRDDISKFRAADVEILGVSTDPVASHQVFAQKYQLNFPLLADDKKEVAQLYGALNPEKGYAKRMTYLIDKAGIIRRIIPAVQVDGHSEELQRAVKALAPTLPID
ncbi:MAG: peroxiredoxin [Nitrospirae bacterium]|nr:peroxiredoxin [Candidatus Manganitrophaceae bacterium]